MQLKAVACLYAETFKLAKVLCDTTAYAKAKSTHDIFRVVGGFLIVIFFIVVIVLCMRGGNPFVPTVYFVCGADISCTARNFLC